MRSAYEIIAPILTTAGSLLMLLYTFYYIVKLSYSSGFYSALLLAARLNSTIIAQEGITNLASQYSATALGLYMTYILLPFGLIALVMSTLLLFSRSHSRMGWATVAFSSVVIIVVAAIIEATFGGHYITTYSMLLYAGVAIALVPSAYLAIHSRKEERIAHARPIAINPDTPYTNMLVLSGRLMSRLSGNIRILDMHFDAKALENLSRLTQGREGNYRSFMILTKKDRLGKEFSLGYADFVDEMRKKGISFELRVVPDELIAGQHERLILDESTAYKIPPLNIINKKSEHIIGINYNEARGRFDYLWSMSTKFENMKR
ncbi:MAG: hypothetical protein ACP5UH_03055 [Candidatus Micrarchaeia archaeon]